MICGMCITAIIVVVNGGLWIAVSVVEMLIENTRLAWSRAG